MSKSEARAGEKAAAPSKKRKLAEAEEAGETGAGAAAAAKRARKSRQEDKKSKGDNKKKKKSHRERKAEEAEALNREEFDVEDEAMDVEGAVGGPAAAEGEESKKKEENKEKEKSSKKKGKKNKKVKSAGEEGEENEVSAEAADGQEGEKKKKKKSKKDKNAQMDQEAVNGDKAGDEDAVDEGDNRPVKNSRFICFIGNLPYTATQADVKAHFAALKPSSVRLLTERGQPQKSRGIAFVEFDNYAHMKTCLAKFHHTELTDARGSTRRINVELTAGGGGKKEGRMGKVAEKNRRLNEERGRRIAREEQEKLENARARAGKEAAPKEEEEREEHMVHPSRRAHVPGRRS